LTSSVPFSRSTTRSAHNPCEAGGAVLPLAGSRSTWPQQPDSPVGHRETVLGAASQSTGSSGGCQAKPAHHLRGPGPCEAGGTLTGAGRARAPVSRFPPARLIWPGKGQTSLAPRASGPKACPFRPQIHRQSGQTSPPRGHLGSRFVRSSRRSTPVTPRGHERTWEEGDSDGATKRRSEEAWNDGSAERGRP
jgi:hypothetical protein